VGGSSDNFHISLSNFITFFSCFYFNFFFFVFRHYQYYFRVPPGIRVPQVGNHWDIGLERNPRESWEVSNKKVYITHDETCHEFSTGITAVYTTLRLRIVKTFHTSYSELTNHVNTCAKPMHVSSQAANHVQKSTLAHRKANAGVKKHGRFSTRTPSWLLYADIRPDNPSLT
jgi:hypothetical protein